MQIKSSKLKNTDKGITLIALVITIIVLLILAGVAIITLTGENGILTKTVEAKEKTYMAELKEKADLVKTDLIAENIIKGIETKNTDIAKAIKDDSNFSGSRLSGNNKVVTADGKYDIIVESNLNIKVVKHTETDSKELTLSFEEIETESRAILLKVTVEGRTTVEEWLRSLSTEELKQTFAEGLLSAEGIPVEEATWEKLCEEDGVEYVDVRDLWNKWNENGWVMDTYENEYEFMIAEEMYIYKGDVINLACNGDSIEVIDSGEFVITTNGEYTVTATGENGETGSAVATVTKCKTEKYSEIQETNKTMTIDGYEVTVPAGFAYGVSENVGKVKTGLVITDKVDSEGNSIGNEFVWIPVETAISDTEANGTTTKAMAVNMGTETNPQYRGLLYNFTDTGPEVISGCTNLTSTGYREPDIVSTYDNEPTYNNGLFTKESLQNDYNDMIKSVSINHGFYVSRYEMGIESGKAISKLGILPTSAESSETNMWYGLYGKAKTYTNSKDSVTSSMIWGSQYDAMLNFALTNGNDSSKVTAEGNGNHSEKVIKTGLTKTSDSINNIYDLEGNLYEWTLEAKYSSGRAYRGGRYSYSGSPANRNGYYSNITDSYSSSRLTLYIK